MKWQKSEYRTAFECLLASGPENHDIAEMNLLCAVGLNGAEYLDIDSCLSKLATWTDAVRRYTQDTRSSYYKDPNYYHRHQGFFRFLAIATCLKHPKSLGLSYQPTAINNYLMKDSRDDFIHGLLTRGLGTCASFPVLFVAIGRRLGYPLFLAKSKHHFYCQWLNGDGALANLECAGPGGAEMFPYEHYLNLKGGFTPDQLASKRFLRPLTPKEELAAFLITRGHCLRDNGRLDEAREAYTQAHRFDRCDQLFGEHMHQILVDEDQQAWGRVGVRSVKKIEPPRGRIVVLRNQTVSAFVNK